MAKLTAPLLSFGSSGQIGKTMVTASWRGVKYARQYVIPGYSNTTQQQDIRALFAYLREMWKLAPAIVQAPWNAFASGRPFTGMNKLVGENVRVMKYQSDMDNMIFSPGAGGGLPPANIAAVQGGSTGEIDVTADEPTAPTGWTFSALVACAVPDADPTGIFTGPFVAAEDDTTPFAITLSGLGAAVPCQVGVWARWTKANGQTAYSVSQTFQATSGA